MYFFKNSELAKKYNVSNPTVGEWIKQAITGNNFLQLIKVNEKYRILNNEHNHAELFKLAESGKKYRNKILSKEIKLESSFYKLYSSEEIIDMMNDLRFKNQVKIKYSYKGIGAKYWDEYYHGGDYPVKTSLLELLENSFNDIKYYTKKLKINLIDIGPGNAYPVKDVIKELKKEDRIKKYIAVDISKDMNNIALNNIRDWFGNLETENYIFDAENASFSEILFKHKSEAKDLVNLIFHFGSTMNNHDDRVRVLKNLRNGMTQNDILLIAMSLDTLENKSGLGHFTSTEADLQDTWTLKAMGVDVENCFLETKYDEKLNAKVKILELDKNYLIRYKVFGFENEVGLNKGDKINIWNHYLINTKDFINELDKAGMVMTGLKIDKNFNNALVMCQANTKFNSWN
jgi:SAM-dependent methyltransferase